MKITKRQLRRIIKEEIMKEQDEDLSSSDFIKGLKAGADEIASGMPKQLNDDLATAIKSLSAMAKFDRSKFQKITALIADYAINALEKEDKR